MFTNISNILRCSQDYVDFSVHDFSLENNVDVVRPMDRYFLHFDTSDARVVCRVVTLQKTYLQLDPSIAKSNMYNSDLK